MLELNDLTTEGHNDDFVNVKIEITEGEVKITLAWADAKDWAFIVPGKKVEQLKKFFAENS